MDKRRGFGALLGTGVLMFALAGAVAAVVPDSAPTYSISVTKTTDPATVPAEGGDVTFTVWVDNTGTGLFNIVSVTDSLVGCTVAFSAGDTNTNGSLDADEVWSYTCTVSDVAPNTTNVATVDACHNGSACNHAAHDATGEGQVTVGLCESDCVVAPTAPPTAPPTTAPTAEPTLAPTAPPGGTGGGESDVPTAPTTDTLGEGGISGPADSGWFLIAALGVLLGSLVVLRPSERKHRS
jgi:uncharacterized repeat protein (TIGR01451 family)